MTIKVLNQNGGESGSIQLVEEVFGVDLHQACIYDAVRNEQANKRQGTHSTKNRSEVNYAKSKPYRQKGTGRARAGFRGSPLWRHGGIIFGPLPRDYSYRLPRKVKRLAFRSLLSHKLHRDSLIVVEDFAPIHGRTKEAVAFLKPFVSDEQKTVLIYKDDNELLKRSLRNIPWIKPISCSRLNAIDLYLAKHVILFKSAAEQLNDLLNPSKG